MTRHTPEPSILCNCGCELINHGSELGLEILYCSLHDAAPLMLEALEAMLSRFGGYPDRGEITAARTAIAAATTTEADETLEANRHLLRGDTDWEKRI